MSERVKRVDNSLFLKKNKKKYINVFTFPASKAFRNKEGKPIEWKFRRLDTVDERELARELNEKAGSPLGFLGNTQSKAEWLLYWRNKLAMACLYPDLKTKELQKDYGCEDEYELFDKLLDDPDEFARLIVEYQNQFLIKREWFGEQK